ncbi:putative defensin-like protein 256 [Eutrema salsugineum]|uniref:putative defensin-like protein 256 n=1 Tax=Eutrema salsugineum TaxID=72664 RepID=UPI000CED72CB|nr:putative defensin-like protein 256 [Eutrema salsugineum]
MKSISFKLLLLVSLLVVVFRQNSVVADLCTTDEECRRMCLCDEVYCDLKIHQCHLKFNATDTIDVSPSKTHCIPEDKNCGGREGPPPRRLKL